MRRVKIKTALANTSLKVMESKDTLKINKEKEKTTTKFKREFKCRKDWTRQEVY